MPIDYQPADKPLEKIRQTFTQLFAKTNLRLPEENLRERRPGSLPWGSGRVLFVFGKEDGREYLEYYAHHRIGGDSHGKIADDGMHASLPVLCSAVCFNPEIPGDEEKKRREMEAEYRKTWEDLERKGLLAAGPGAGSDGAACASRDAGGPGMIFRRENFSGTGPRPFSPSPRPDIRGCDAGRSTQDSPGNRVQGF